MKFVAISDTHSFHRVLTPKLKKIREEKGKFILICAGDVSFVGEIDIIEDYNQWVGELKQEDIIEDCVGIFGNHEKTSDLACSQFALKEWADQAKRNYDRVMSSATNYHLLKDKEVIIGGIKFYGCFSTPRFGGGWAHQLYTEQDKRDCYDKIPLDVDIFIGHGPPYQCLDIVDRGALFRTNEGIVNAGCPILREYLQRIKPYYFICGHLHDERNHKIIWINEKTQVINAAICNEQYKPISDPLFFELTK